MNEDFYFNEWNEQSIQDDGMPWSEPSPDIQPVFEYGSESSSGPEPEPIRIPTIKTIINFEDTSNLKNFIKNNKLDNDWYIVLATKDKGAIRTDLRPNRGKKHPCYLFNMQ